MTPQLRSILAGAVAMAAAATGADAQQLVGMASLPQGTQNFFQVSALAKVVQQHTDLRPRVNPLRGPTLTLAALNAGEVEFSMGSLPEAVEAFTQTGQYKERRLEKLRVIFNNQPLNMGIFVRKDSNIRTVADLKGKRMPTGWQAFPTSIVYLTAILKTAGLTMDDLVAVPVPELIRSVEDFKEGKNVGTVVAVGAPIVTEASAAVGGLRYLSIPDVPNVDAIVGSVRQGLYTRIIHPAPRFVGIEGPTRVLAFDIVFTSSTLVADDIVYKVVKAAHDNKDELVKAHASFAGFQTGGMAKRFPAIPHHPGAVKFFKEVGLWKE